MKTVKMSVSVNRVLMFLCGYAEFSRGPPSLLGIHTVPAIPAVFLSWQVNWREIFFFLTAEHPNYIKDASRAISDP